MRVDGGSPASEEVANRDAGVRLLVKSAPLARAFLTLRSAEFGTGASVAT
jgi:hypothetical protein